MLKYGKVAKKERLVALEEMKTDVITALEAQNKPKHPQLDKLIAQALDTLKSGFAADLTLLDMKKGLKGLWCLSDPTLATEPAISPLDIDPLFLDTNEPVLSVPFVLYDKSLVTLAGLANSHKISWLGAWLKLAPKQKLIRATGSILTDPELTWRGLTSHGRKQAKQYYVDQAYLFWIHGLTKSRDLTDGLAFRIKAKERFENLSDQEKLLYHMFRKADSDSNIAERLYNSRFVNVHSLLDGSPKESLIGSHFQDYITEPTQQFYG